MADHAPTGGAAGASAEGQASASAVATAGAATAATPTAADNVTGEATPKRSYFEMMGLKAAAAPGKKTKKDKGGTPNPLSKNAQKRANRDKKWAEQVEARREKRRVKRQREKEQRKTDIAAGKDVGRKHAASGAPPPPPPPPRRFPACVPARPAACSLCPSLRIPDGRGTLPAAAAPATVAHGHVAAANTPARRRCARRHPDPLPLCSNPLHPCLTHLFLALLRSHFAVARRRRRRRRRRRCCGRVCARAGDQPHRIRKRSQAAKDIGKRMCNLRICIDLDFDAEHLLPDVKKCAKQLQTCYAANRRAPVPIQYHLTSLESRVEERFKLVNGHNWDCHKHKDNYMQVSRTGCVRAVAVAQAQASRPAGRRPPPRALDQATLYRSCGLAARRAYAAGVGGGARFGVRLDFWSA